MTDPDIDPEELRYAPRPPRRYLWLRRGVLLAVVLALLIAGAVYAYKWTQRQYYVAADADHVAIYQGVQAGLPGVDLSHVYEEQTLLLSQLPSFRRSQVVDGMRGGSLAEARAIVAQLWGFANSCARQQSASTTPTTHSPTRSTGTSGTRGTTTPRRTTRTGHGTTRPRGTQTTTRPHRSPASTRTPRTSPPVTSTTATGSTSGSGIDNTPEECSGSTPLTSTGTSR